jgi:2'-5' RNA ligase
MPAKAAPEPIRAFISIEPPDDLRAQIVAVQKELHLSVKSDLIKWAKPEQLHLTLRFIGAVPEPDAKKILKCIKSACVMHQPFHLHVGGLGCFPNVLKPAVLWVGVQGDTTSLKQLVHQINHEISSVAEAADLQAFFPHVTIARIKEAPLPKLKKLGEALAKQPIHLHGCWDVSRVRLMKSVIKKTGATHELLGEVKLK